MVREDIIIFGPLPSPLLLPLPSPLPGPLYTKQETRTTHWNMNNTDWNYTLSDQLLMRLTVLQAGTVLVVWRWRLTGVLVTRDTIPGPGGTEEVELQDKVPFGKVILACSGADLRI